MRSYTTSASQTKFTAFQLKKVLSVFDPHYDVLYNVLITETNQSPTTWSNGDPAVLTQEGGVRASGTQNTEGVKRDNFHFDPKT